MVGGLTASIVAFAVGAVLDFAFTASPDQHGFNIHTVGVILMIVGAVGATSCGSWRASSWSCGSSALSSAAARVLGGMASIAGSAQPSVTTGDSMGPVVAPL
jgi:predicted lysophospholipase L1 biosynthesis ABC-type transport system permease subunit